MTKQMVRYSIDLHNPPALTEVQKAEIQALKNMPDSEIDLSDIPLLPEEFWKNAVRNPFYKPVKTSTTVRIDADVLAWLRAEGRGYQSRINAILRREMLASIEAPAVKKLTTRKLRSSGTALSRPDVEANAGVRGRR